MPSQNNTVAKTTSGRSSVSRRKPKTTLLKAKLKQFWWFFPILGVVLTIGGISVVRLQNRTKLETKSSTNSLPVAVTEASLEPLKAWIASEGTVQALKLKHLTFNMQGEVTYIAKRDSGNRILRPGDRVKKGELLARVDDREAIADVNKAMATVVEAQKEKSAAAATVAQAQAQVAQAQYQVREKQAQVQKALSELKLAQTRMKRYQKIYEQGVISADDFDTRSLAVEKAKAELQAAQAGVISAEKKVESAKAEVEAAQEKVEAAKSGIVNARSTLTQAKVALEGSRLYAPFNGIVAYINIRENETFDPQLVNSQLGGDYQGILDRVPIVIVDPSILEVAVNLAVENREQVRFSQTAVIADKTNPETQESQKSNNQISMKAVKARGKVFAINPVVSPGTRSIQAIIRISERGMTLQHGERVTAWIMVAGKLRTLVAPLNAFVYRDQKPYIFVVNKKGIVEQRSVELGITGISKQEILSGVKPGESIVVEGQNRLADKAPVKVVRKVEYPSPSLPEISNKE